MAVDGNVGWNSLPRRKRSDQRVRQAGLERTSFGWEDVVIVQHILDPGHDIVNVNWCCELYLFVILVDPSVVQPRYIFPISDIIPAHHGRVLTLDPPTWMDMYGLYSTQQLLHRRDSGSYKSQRLSSARDQHHLAHHNQLLTVHCHPLHDIDIFWQHHDRLKISFHECCLYERTA